MSARLTHACVMGVPSREASFHFGIQHLLIHAFPPAAGDRLCLRTPSRGRNPCSPAFSFSQSGLSRTLTHGDTFSFRKKGAARFYQVITWQILIFEDAASAIELKKLQARDFARARRINSTSLPITKTHLRRRQNNAASPNSSRHMRPGSGTTTTMP